MFRFLLSLALLGLVAGARTPNSAPRMADVDVSVQAAASTQVVLHGRAWVLAHLRSNRNVVSAVLGKDGRTIAIQFRDGNRGAILPAMSSAHRTALQTPAQDAPASARKALVLEPFATELQLGPNAGANIAATLSGSGFQVDRLLDRSVTLDTMRHLSDYKVVYMDTHSGVNQYGEGVVATGVVYDADPAIEPLMKQFAVMTVSVAGSPLLFYGVLSRFISEYEGTFPTHSLVVIDGCEMLRASLFWQALQSKGATALVSWDQEVLPDDAVRSSEAFFSDLASGDSLAEALHTVLSAGLGKSQGGAQLGYLGNGRLTLHGEQALPTSTPTTVPVVPAPTQTSTPTPVVTASSVPSPVPGLLSVDVQGYVRPGRWQTVRVFGATGRSRVHIRIEYPDGSVHNAFAPAVSAAQTVIRYRQPGDVIIPHNRRAHVLVVGADGIVAADAEYTIGYQQIDAAVVPHVIVSPGRLAVLVHTGHLGALRTTVKIGSRTISKNSRVLRPGWSGVTEVQVAVGRPTIGHAAVILSSQSHVYRASAGFRVRP